MATWYGSNATLTRQNVPKEKSGVGEQEGKLRVAYEEYTFTGAAHAASDVIELMKLPAGARIVDWKVNSPVLTGSLGNFDLGLAAGADGEAADPDAFFAAAAFDPGNAAVTLVMSDSTDTAAMMKKLASDTIVQFTVGEATTTAVETIQVAIFYILD